MALRLRRGTDAERQLPGFIPESGELIYTTDTKLVYVGDGTTEGGLPISTGGGGSGGDLVTDLSPQLGGDLGLNSYDIIGTGSINIDGSISVTGPINTDGAVNATGSINTDGSISVTGSVSATSVSASSANLSASLTTPTVNTDTLSANLASVISLENNLNLNSNNIVGIGNINIDGTITATGNINLGDETTDLITITGNISSDIVPSIDDTFELGSITNTWANGYFSQLTVNNAASIDSLTIGSLYNQDSTAIYDSGTDSLSSSIGVFDEVTIDSIFKSNGDPLYYGLLDILEVNEFRGAHRGDVLAEDSSLFFDSLSSTLNVNTANISEIFPPGETLFIGNNEQSANVSIQYEGINNIMRLATVVDSDAFLNFQVSRGTLAAPTAVQSGDIISGSLMSGYTGSDYIRATAVVGQVDPDGGPVSSFAIPGKLLFINSNNNGDNIIASFNSDGVLEAPILKTGEYSTNTARDTSITNPVIGSIVFVSDTNELQVYNGTTWVSVNRSSLDGDLIGSVFGDDSTVLVDGVNGLIVGDVVNSQVTTETLNLTPYTDSTSRDTAIASPVAGQVVYVADVNELQVYNSTGWYGVSKLPKDIEDVAGTAYTVAASDMGKILTFRDAGAVTVTLPDAANTALPLGAYVEIANMDATNPLTVTGTAGQVLSTATGDPTVPGFGAVRAVKVSSTEWLVTGDTA